MLAIASSVVVAILALAAGVFGIAAMASARAVPAPALTPIAAPSPAASPETDAGGSQTATSDVLSGQGVWLVVPDTAPSGVAYLLPDATDDEAASLLEGAGARALLQDGWAVATGDLGGLAWGSPASTANLAELRTWVEADLGALPALYVGAGMGGTTALTAMLRQPETSPACWYAIAPITDLATLVGVQPEIGEQIARAWGQVPSADDNPILGAAGLALDTGYRVIIPSGPAERVADATAFAAALEESGHEVTSVVAPDSATSASLAEDLTAFAKGCRP